MDENNELFKYKMEEKVSVMVGDQEIFTHIVARMDHIDDGIAYAMQCEEGDPLWGKWIKEADVIPN